MKHWKMAVVALVLGVCHIVEAKARPTVEVAVEPENQGQWIAWTMARGRRVGLYEIEVVKAPSSQELNEDQFATRVSESLLRFTRVTQKEACAVLCQSEQGDWLARVVTIHAHTACAVIQEPIELACPQGYASTGSDIHSHPEVEQYLPNAVDRLFLNQRYEHRQKARTSPEVISPRDFDSKSGYVIHQGGFFHHQGNPESVREVFDRQEWGWSVSQWRQRDFSEVDPRNNPGVSLQGG